MMLVQVYHNMSTQISSYKQKKKHCSDFTFFLIELITLALMSCTLEHNNSRQYRNYNPVRTQYCFPVKCRLALTKGLEKWSYNNKRIFRLYWDRYILQPPQKHFLNAGTKKIEYHDV